MFVAQLRNHEERVEISWRYTHLNHPLDESVPIQLAIEEGKAIASANMLARSPKDVSSISSNGHSNEPGHDSERATSEYGVNISVERNYKLPNSLREFVRNAVRRGVDFDTFQIELSKGILIKIGYLGWEAIIDRAHWLNSTDAIRRERKRAGIDPHLIEPEAGKQELLRSKQMCPQANPPPQELLLRSIQLVKDIGQGQKPRDELLGPATGRTKLPTRQESMSVLCEELRECNDVFRLVVERFSRDMPGDLRYSKIREENVRDARVLQDLTGVVITFKKKLYQALLPGRNVEASPIQQATRRE